MERLRQRSDFLAAAGGAKVATPGFVLQALARGDGGAVRLGFTVSKKVGNAVERNRVRRRLKEVVRHSAAAQPLRSQPESATSYPASPPVRAGLQEGHDYVLIGRRAAITEPFTRLVEDFERALQRLQHTRMARPASGEKRRGVRQKSE